MRNSKIMLIYIALNIVGLCGNVLAVCTTNATTKTTSCKCANKLNSCTGTKPYCGDNSGKYSVSSCYSSMSACITAMNKTKYCGAQCALPTASGDPAGSTTSFSAKYSALTDASCVPAPVSLPEKTSITFACTGPTAS